VSHFLERRIVVSTGLRESSSRRRKKHLEINSDHAFAIGLDIGASHVTAILLDLDGQVAGEKSPGSSSSGGSSRRQGPA
jgi:hypothetical protein